MRDTNAVAATPATKSVEEQLGAWEDVKAEALAPTLQGYDDLSRGMLVRYAGTRKLESRGNHYTLHRFITRAGAGQPFELWGAAQLNGKLKVLRGSPVIFLKYNGKHANPENPGQDVHDFTVRVAPAGANVAELLKGMAPAADALDRAVRLAADKERERRQSQGNTYTQSGGPGAEAWQGPGPDAEADNIPF